MQKIKYFILSTFLLAGGLFTSCNNTSITSDVMVVGVNDVNPNFNEIDILIDSLEHKRTQTIDNINFHIGNYKNKKVVIAETPVGEVGAAMTTTLGIKHFNPKAVISEGTSGGHNFAARVNQIVLGETIIDTSSYKGDGAHPSTWTLIQPVLNSNARLLEVAKNTTYEHGIRLGTIASSNVWNTDYDFITELNLKFHEDCEEMESYAITSVCNNYNIPSLAIRVISNNLMSGEAFDVTAGKNCQRYTLDVINAI